MNRIIGRILLLAVTLAIAGGLGYYFFSRDLDTVEIIILGTLFMVLGESAYHLDKRLFRDRK